MHLKMWLIIKEKSENKKRKKICGIYRLTVEGRNASVRAVESEQIEREQQQTIETPKETPNAAAAPAQSRWFPCFSCAFCS